jgi:hypothetical protein
MRKGTHNKNTIKGGTSRMSRKSRSPPRTSRSIFKKYSKTPIFKSVSRKSLSLKPTTPSLESIYNAHRKRIAKSAVTRSSLNVG